MRLFKSKDNELRSGGILIKRGNLGGAIGFHYAWILLQDKGLINMPARGGEAFFSAVLIIMVIIVFYILPKLPNGADLTSAGGKQNINENMGGN